MAKVLTPGDRIDGHNALVRLAGELVTEVGQPIHIEAYEDTANGLFYGTRNGEVYAMCGKREGVFAWIQGQRDLREMLNM